MQENTTKKGQDFTKARRANGIHIVDTARIASSGADAVREAQMNLVRAEQNLYALVQANQASAGPTSAFGYAAPQTIAAAYGASSYVPGFTPSPAFSPPIGPTFGLVPGMNPWSAVPQSAMSPWSSWASGIPAPAGSLHATPGFAPGSFAPSSAFAAGIGGRALACDIIDEGKQFICQLELPGVEADQVELLCLENAVAVNAFRESEGDVANLVQSERGNATQQRVITLPSQIQPAGAKATLSNGILTIVLPKLHPTEGPRRVEVQG